MMMTPRCSSCGNFCQIGSSGQSLIAGSKPTRQGASEQDIENAFDELKNQWGWGGFTTQDLARCRLAACMVALVYNWWNIFVRLAEPDKHLEAITSRPLLLAGIAERTRHGRQTSLKIASTHGRAKWAQRVLTDVARFLRGLTNTAEQLTADDRWARILAHAVRSWLKGRRLRDPPRLVAPA
jgi:hypothetical protein